MNVKKLSLMLIVLLGLVASLGVISADNPEFKFANGVLNIEHATVHIPNGFSENQNLRQVDVHTTVLNNVPAEQTIGVFVSGNKNITVAYYEIEDGVSVDLSPAGNTVVKTIAGHQGLFEQHDDGTCSFSYIVPDDGKGDLVEITAPSEQIIADMIK